MYFACQKYVLVGHLDLVLVSIIVIRRKTKICCIYNRFSAYIEYCSASFPNETHFRVLKQYLVLVVIICQLFSFSFSTALEILVLVQLLKMLTCY